MTESNEAIVIEITQVHRPRVMDRVGGAEDAYEDVPMLECWAKDCNYSDDAGDGESWAKHLLNVINDHLGLWGPDFEDGDCTACYHEEKEHGPEGCNETNGGMGAADNTDVYEVDCDCARPGPGKPAEEFHW